MADFNDETAVNQLSLEEQEEDFTGGLRAQASNIKYNYFRKGSSIGTVVYSTNVGALKNTRHDAHKETIYIIHGWTNNNKSTINTSIRDALLKHHDVNIFVVDWSRYSRLDYASAQLRVQAVSNTILVAK